MHFSSLMHELKLLFFMVGISLHVMIFGIEGINEELVIMLGVLCVLVMGLLLLKDLVLKEIDMKIITIKSIYEKIYVEIILIINEIILVLTKTKQERVFLDILLKKSLKDFLINKVKIQEGKIILVTEEVVKKEVSKLLDLKISRLYLSMVCELFSTELQYIFKKTEKEWNSWFKNKYIVDISYGKYVDYSLKKFIINKIKNNLLLSGSRFSLDSCLLLAYENSKFFTDNIKQITFFKKEWNILKIKSKNLLIIKFLDNKINILR